MIIDANLVFGIFAIISVVLILILWLSKLWRLWWDSDTAFLILHYFYERKNK